MFDNPRALTDDELQTMRFCRDLSTWRETEEISFQERLNELIAENAEFPCFFASTEY